MLRGFPLAWQVTPAHVFIDHQLLFCCCHSSENEKFIIGETTQNTRVKSAQSQPSHNHLSQTQNKLHEFLSMFILNLTHSVNPNSYWKWFRVILLRKSFISLLSCLWCSCYSTPILTSQDFFVYFCRAKIISNIYRYSLDVWIENPSVSLKTQFYFCPTAQEHYIQNSRGRGQEVWNIMTHNPNMTGHYYMYIWNLQEN